MTDAQRLDAERYRAALEEIATHRPRFRTVEGPDGRPVVEKVGSTVREIARAALEAKP